tara:strand:- start:4529 stop:4663 length:135 start_codon:yes stop_codon:yes gene_type:complete
MIGILFGQLPWFEVACAVLPVTGLLVTPLLAKHLGSCPNNNTLE